MVHSNKIIKAVTKKLVYLEYRCHEILLLQSLATIVVHHSNLTTASRLTRVIAARLAANFLGLLTALTVAPIADLAAILNFLT